MSTPRRDFLSWLGASGLSAATGTPLGPRGVVPMQQPISDKWDMSWTDRVKGKHRAIFDSPAVAEGAGLFRSVIWQKQHTAVYGTAASDMTSVLVIRHEGIPLVMNDAYWDKYEVGKSIKLKDDKTKKWTRINPIAVTPPGTPANFADYSLERFIAAGNIVLACNMAFADIVDNVKQKEKLSQDDARKSAIAQMVKGVILQPSGVFAVLRAQEAGCNYIMAT